MNILGLIPARGGSKSIPRKNVVPLMGKPLIEYTFEAACASEHLTRRLLSTDDSDIAALARKFGIEVPFLRPANLAADETPILPVIQHLLAWLVEHDDYVCDVVVLLQPTSPLRQAKHIDAAVDLLLETGADTVVSVIPVPHQFNPVSVMRLDRQQLVRFMDGPLILRRQDKPRVYARNGPAVLAIRREVVLSGQLYGKVVRGFEMSTVDSVDIDDELDLALAEFWLSRREIMQ